MQRMTFQARATNPRIAGGNCACTARAAASVENSANTQAPEPLMRASPYCLKPGQMARHFRIAFAHHGLEVVTQGASFQPVEKGRNFDRFRLPCQFRRGEYSGGRHLHRRHQHQIPCAAAAPAASVPRPRLRQTHSRRTRTPARPRPVRSASSCSSRAFQAQPPQVVERDQGGGRVRTAAAQPAAHGDALVEFDFDAASDARSPA